MVFLQVSPKTPPNSHPCPLPLFPSPLSPLSLPSHNFVLLPKNPPPYPLSPLSIYPATQFPQIPSYSLNNKTLPSTPPFPVTLTSDFNFSLKKISPKTCTSKNKYLTLHSQSPGGGMVDALVSGTSAARRAGSSPVLGTHKSRK